MPLKVSHGIGAWIKDFKTSTNPRFKGKSDKERRDQAIAAYLSAKRDQKEEVDKSPPFDGPYKKKQSVVPGKHGEGPSTAKHLAKMGMKQAEKKPVKEGVKGYNPGWMLKADPKLGAAVKAKQDLAKKRQATYGKPEAGKSVKEVSTNESEQLDELSPGLLGRYTRARGSLNITKKQSKMKARAHQKMRDKTKDLSAIAGKYSNPADLTKVEATTFEVDIEGLPKMYIKDKSPGAVKAKLRGIVKQPSMIQGVDRVTDAEMKKTYRDKAQGRDEKEMDEGLDELSKATLGSYIRKASGNAASATRAAGVEAGARGPNRFANMDSKEKRAEKRLTGVSKAVDKLTKEEVNEISGELAQRYHDKAVKAPAPKDKKDPIKHTLKRFASMQKAQDIIHKSELKRIGGQK